MSPSFPSRLTVLAAGLLLACAVHADVTHKFNLPSETLTKSVNAIARDTDTQVIFAARHAEGLQAPALSGQYTARQALDSVRRGIVSYSTA